MSHATSPSPRNVYVPFAVVLTTFFVLLHAFCISSNLFCDAFEPYSPVKSRVQDFRSIQSKKWVDKSRFTTCSVFYPNFKSRIDLNLATTETNSNSNTNRINVNNPDKSTSKRTSHKSKRKTNNKKDISDLNVSQGKKKFQHSNSIQGKQKKQSRRKFSRKKQTNLNGEPNRRKDTIERAKSSLNEEFKTKLKNMFVRYKNNETLTQEYCDEVMGLCVAADDWDEVLNILDVMKSQQLSQKISTYRACLIQCRRVHNVDSALSILGAMNQANIRPEGQDLGTVLDILCKLGNWQRSMNLVKQYTEKTSQNLFDKNCTDINDSNIYLIPVENYNAIIHLMAKAKRWKEPIQFLSFMESNKLPILHPSPTLATYNAVLEACSQASQPEQAMQILQSMVSSSSSDKKKGVTPNTHSYNLVISACLKKQQWRRAMNLLEMMNDSSPAVPLTTVTYNSVISCCAKAGEVHQAMSLLKLMRSHKVKPDTITYNALMSACTRSYKTANNALELLDQLNREPGVDPDIITYTIAIRACAKIGKTTRGLSIFQMMNDKKLKLDVHVYTSVMDLCAKAGMWKQSLDLLDEMRERGIFPNGYTYSVAIAACGKGGQWERSLELLYQMKEKDIQINTITYNAAISALASASTKNMRQTLKEERSKEYKEKGESFSSLESGSYMYDSSSFRQSEQNQLWRKALNLVDQMKEAGVKPDAISYSSAIKACGAAGRWKEALNIISIMQKGGPSIRPNRISYTNAITACGRSGQYKHALQLFNDMKNDGVQPDRVSYNALIFALKTANQPDQVFQLWNEMCGSNNLEQGSESDVSDATIIATATPDARKIAPDIITVTDVINALERSPGTQYRAKSDLVFKEAVKRKILFKTDSLDTVWEVDLSGMSFPVAHAAVRFALQRAYSSYADDGKLEDFTFITGIGSSHLKKKDKDSGDDFDESDENDDGTPVALREFIRSCLNTEFEPLIVATVPQFAPGTVMINKQVLKEWMDAKRQQEKA